MSSDGKLGRNDEGFGSEMTGRLGDAARDAASRTGAGVVRIAGVRAATRIVQVHRSVLDRSTGIGHCRCLRGPRCPAMRALGLVRYGFASMLTFGENKLLRNMKRTGHVGGENAQEGQPCCHSSRARRHSLSPTQAVERNADVTTRIFRILREPAAVSNAPSLFARPRLGPARH